MQDGSVSKAWIVIPALSFVAGVLAALLLTGSLPAPALWSHPQQPTTFAPTIQPTPSALPSFTPTPATSSTPIPPTPTDTPVPPTPTSTHTPTATPTPPPTSTMISLPSPEAPVPPAIPVVITRAEWGSMEITEGYVPHTPDRITIHHDGSEFYGGAVGRMRSLQTGSRNRGWVDIPYHFLIDQEGNIYEGRPLQYVGDTATEYDPTGHALITVMGNYMIQEINEAQLAAIVDLAAWLSYEYSIPPELIKGHRDYAATSCPGTNLYRYLADGYLVSAVEERLNFGTQ
jgi:hypothetical protein